MLKIVKIKVLVILLIVSIGQVAVGEIKKHNENAHKLLQSRQYEKLIKYLAQVRKKYYNHLTYYILGEAYRLNHKYKHAIKYYKESVKLFSESDSEVLKKHKALIYSGLGFAYAKLGKSALAIKYYLNGLEYVKDSVILFTNIGQNYLRLKDYKNALQYFTKALEIEENHINALKGVGRSYFALGKYKESIFIYNKLKEINPNDKDAYFGLGYNLNKLKESILSKKMFAKAFYISGNYEKSINYIRGIKSYEDDKELYIILISSNMYLMRYKEAEVLIKAGLKKYRTGEDFIFLEGQLAFLQKQYKEALEKIRKGLKKFPDSHKLYVLRGHSYLELKEKEKAINSYNEALKLKEDDVATRERLAHLYRQDGKHNLEFYHQGVVYFFTGDYKQSGHVLGWVDKNKFKYKSGLYYYEGMVKWALNDTRKAVEKFLLSVKEDPSYYLAYMALARAYSSLKQNYKALSLLSDYNNKNPKSKYKAKINILYKELSSKGK